MKHILLALTMTVIGCSDEGCPPQDPPPEPTPEVQCQYRDPALCDGGNGGGGP
jgi:hypothetical protein